MKHLTAFFIVLIIALVVVATVLAAPPEKETFSYDINYDLVDCGEVGVGNFWIWNNEVGEVALKSYYDKDGNLAREKWHTNGTDHLYAEGHREKDVSGNFVSNGTTYFDPETGDPTFSHEPGNWWHIHLPGNGWIVHFAGLENFQFDPDTGWELVKETGVRFVDLVFLCEYLAPES